MITIETLYKLIDNYEQIILLAQSFGYEDLRLFCSYNEEDKDKLNFIGTFNSVQIQLSTKGKEFNEELALLLGVEVNFLGEGAISLRHNDYEEAKSAPLFDMSKVIDYFVDTLIPYSTNQEIVKESRSLAREKWQQKLAQISAAKQFESNENKMFTFFSSHTQSTVAKPALEQLSKVLDSFGRNPQAWAEATELFNQKKQSIGTLSSSQVSRNEDKFPLSYNLQGPNPTSTFSSLHSLKFNLNGRRLEISLDSNKVDNFKFQGILRDQALKQNLGYFEDPDGTAGILLSQDNLVKSEIEKFVSNLKQLGYVVDLEEEKKLDVEYKEKSFVNKR